MRPSSAEWAFLLQRCQHCALYWLMGCVSLTQGWLIWLQWALATFNIWHVYESIINKYCVADWIHFWDNEHGDWCAHPCFNIRHALRTIALWGTQLYLVSKHVLGDLFTCVQNVSVIRFRSLISSFLRAHHACLCVTDC